jgi:hypothetical protein
MRRCIVVNKNVIIIINVRGIAALVYYDSLCNDQQRRDRKWAAMCTPQSGEYLIPYDNVLRFVSLTNITIS